MRILSLHVLIFGVGCLGCTPPDPSKLDTNAVFSDAKVINLVKAANNGDLIAIKGLAKNGVNFNTEGHYGITPLLHLLYSGPKHKPGFVALLESGADPNILDSKGYCAVSRAAEEPDSFWLEQILKNGGNPNVVSKGNTISSGWTPIFFAISSRKLDNSKLLVSAGANKDQLDDMGSFPLIWACQRVSYDIAFHLLESGADYRQKNSGGVDLVEWVSSRNESYIIEEDQKLWFRKILSSLRQKGCKIELAVD